jgi:hypothetical protein
MKRDTIANMLGASSTGTAHSLLIERENNGDVRFTVVGHDGKKRHAAVILPSTVAESVATALQAAIWENN